MSHASKHWSRLTSVGVLLAGGLSFACSTASDSETADGTGGAGGAGGSAPATGGSSATGGTATGGSGGSQTGGSSRGGSGGSIAGQSAGGSASANGGAAGGGAGGAGRPSSGGSTSGDGGMSSGSAGESSSECKPKSTLAVGMHVVMDISWPDTLATTKGTGQFHLWNLLKYDVDGTKLTGELRACGSVLPPVDLSTIAGGGHALIEIPDSVWDEPSMPRFEATGTLSGWSPGAEFKVDPAPALIGLTLADPTATWPDKGVDIETVDAEGDMKPGLTGTSKSDSGFVRAPTSILGQVGAVADLVYLVTRTIVGHNATLSSCTEASGTSEVTFFDNHVVGCHVYNGDECDATQADFIDSNRTIYTVHSATCTTKFIDDSASCADVRAALPQ